MDLASRVDLPRVERILDVGCGPGNSTAVLRARWPGAAITAIDSSPEMIDAARVDDPAGDWVAADYRSWTPDTRYDLVFSNAALHWIPRHEELIPRLFSMTAAGGAVAAQVPAIIDSPVHRAARRAAENEHLSKQSRRVELWHTIYYHVMRSHQEIIQWYASTGLKVYLSRIPTEQQRQRFTQQVLAGCAADYPVADDGTILFPFKRLFMIAYA